VGSVGSPVLWGLWAFCLVRVEYQTARKLGEQLLQIAQTAQDPALLVEAHFTFGITLASQAEFPQARVHLEQGLACYDPQQQHTLTFRYGGQDPGATCGCFAAWVLWQLGYPEQARVRIREALTLVQELSHPPSLAFAHGMAAYYHQFCREHQNVQEQTEAAIQLCTEHKIGFWLTWSTILHGWVRGVQGQAEEGSAEIRQGLANMRAAHAEFHRPCQLALLAEVHWKGGWAEEGLTLLAESQATIADTGERYYEAEVYRLKGELTLEKFKASPELSRRVQGSESNGEEEAEACFHKAIATAQKQQAKSWELRAAMSLARLWQQQGKNAESHELLAPVYNWFTEGFDTADLKDARALLDELS